MARTYFATDCYAGDYIRERAIAKIAEDEEVALVVTDPMTDAEDWFYPLYVHYDDGLIVAFGIFPEELRTHPEEAWEEIIHACHIDVTLDAAGVYRLPESYFVRPDA